MYYDTDYCQWISDDAAHKLNVIDYLKLIKGPISAGTVLVLNAYDKKFLMFQTILTIDLSCVSELSLAGYEPGSIVYFPGVKSRRIPVCRLRDCRLPTKYEMKFYLKNSTV